MLEKKKNKLLRITTIPLSLDVLLKGQLKYLNQFYDVVAVSSSGKHLDNVREREGIRVAEVEIEREISLLKDFSSLIKLIFLLKKEKPRIIHANTPKASLLSMLAGWICRVPVRIYTVTGLRFEGLPKGGKQNLLINMERLTTLLATDVIPEGKGVKQKLIEYKITKKPLDIICNGNINGIDVNYYDSSRLPEEELNTIRGNYKIASDDFVFCFVGRCVIDKGIVELIDSFLKLKKDNKNVRLLLVGTIERNGNLLPDAIISKLENNSDGIIFTNEWVEDVRPYLAISDVFSFPSYREGFPNVVMQAGAMGLASIVTDVNGSNEIIIEGVNGTIIPVKDSEGLLNAMRSLFVDVEKLNNMKINARKLIVERYSQQDVWSGLLERYRSLDHCV